MKTTLLAFILLFTIFSQAQTANPATLVECSMNSDGYAYFDLSMVTPQVLGSQSSANHNVNYYVSQNDANNGTNPIANSLYTNITPYMQTIYSRVEVISTGNFAVSTVDLIAVDLPAINSFVGIVKCDDIPKDGKTIFDLTQSEVFIFNNNPTFFAAYFTSLTAATTNANHITNPQNFTNASNPQTIYVRVEDSNVPCYNTTSFTISVVDCSLDFDNDLVANGNEDIDGNGNLADDDSDNDGVPDYSDNDDDGDGTLTADEDYNNNGDPMDDDTNANGTPDYLDAGVTFSVSGFAVQQFSMYPNPSRGTVNLQFENPVEVTTISISNLNGKVVKKIRLGNTITATSINLSMLSPGVYFVSVNTYQGNIPHKIVIE